MKRLLAFASVALLLTAPAFGAGRKPQTVEIPQTVQIGHTQVPAGNYKLSYTGTGANVQVTLTQAGKTVVTFAAKAVDQKNPDGGVTYHTSAGVANLDSILLSNTTLQAVSSAQVGQ